MDFMGHNNDDEEFKQMFSAHLNKLHTSILDTPRGALRPLASLTSTPFPGPHNDIPHAVTELNEDSIQQSANKMLNYSADEQMPKDFTFMSALEELDLNKTYSSKTMDSKQLTVMLTALEE